MKHLKKRRFASLGRRLKLTQPGNGPFIISGEKIEIKPLNGRRESEVHLPENRFPTLQALERDYIKKVLNYARENRTRAAEILGIDRVSLWRKMKKHEIAAPDATGLEG